MRTVHNIKEQLEETVPHLVWIKFGTDVALYWFSLRYAIARVHGLTNEVQKRYTTKCIADMAYFLMTVTSFLDILPGHLVDRFDVTSRLDFTLPYAESSFCSSMNGVIP